MSDVYEIVAELMDSGEYGQAAETFISNHISLIEAVETERSANGKRQYKVILHANDKTVTFIHDNDYAPNIVLDLAEALFYSFTEMSDDNLDDLKSVACLPLNNVEDFRALEKRLGGLVSLNEIVQFVFDSEDIEVLRLLH